MKSKKLERKAASRPAPEAFHQTTWAEVKWSVPWYRSFAPKRVIYARAKS
ncbi:MAG: hypothetical protein L0226_17285 [Acidobacteria bacterium]|nr:hypothetical protein [Acidobacteriota bacterium]